MTTFADGPLEEQIAQWRAYLRRRQGVHGPDVEELEGHLRDLLVALTEAGLSGDEAFLVAVKRMGSLDALSREFARAHSERLWKQLVIAGDADKSANTAHAETLVVLFPPVFRYVCPGGDLPVLRTGLGDVEGDGRLKLIMWEVTRMKAVQAALVGLLPCPAADHGIVHGAGKIAHKLT